MFDWVLNIPFICNANQLTGFYLIRIFTEKFFQRGYWNLDFNSYNSTKYGSNFTLKKSTLNMEKFASLKKIHTKIIIVKRNLELNDLEFLCYSAKACPDLSGFVYVHFSIFISHFLDITKTGNFGTPFSNGKNETKWQGTWGMLQWPSLVHWGS